MEAVKAGGDRQQLHEIIRGHSLTAWAAVARGEPNPLPDLLASDPVLVALLPPERLRGLLDAGDYVGEAPMRARDLARQARKRLDSAQNET